MSRKHYVIEIALLFLMALFCRMVCGFDERSSLDKDCVFRKFIIKSSTFQQDMKPEILTVG